MKKYLLFVVIFFLPVALFGEDESEKRYQVVRGKVVDEQTLQPIPGVNIIVMDTDPIIGTSTDMDGKFRFEEITIGRISLKFTFIGYYEVIIPNILVDAGKEVVLDVKLTESVSMLDDIVIEAGQGEAYELVNEMATVSARGFNLEETKRYAGSRDDPARMAQNFAGVSGANDARNDIIIRGNSPIGLLWRLEGINIPNPNHFAAVGTTGGPVCMLNNNLLSDSEFYTGAFPATYGNALSGAFDLRMRNGNNEKREYLGQIGFNGFELGAEGPFKKGSESSYLANYRYSVPALVKDLNLNIGTGEAVPYYQDLSFKLNFRLPQGRISLFGLGGKSHIDLLGSETSADEIDESLYNGYDMDIYNYSETGIAGLNYLQFLGKNSYLTTSVAYTTTTFGADIDTVFRNNDFEVTNVQNYVSDEVNEDKIIFSTVLHHRFNAKNKLETGINIDFIDAVLFREILWFTGNDQYISSMDYDGNTCLLQGHIAWQHRFSDQWTLNTGLHYQNLLLNSASEALEPRLGLRYQFIRNHSINIAYGRHNQMQASIVYFVETEGPDNEVLRTNKELGFTTADHIVLGYNWMIRPDLKLVLETYYQDLKNVPVEKNPSTFSMVNAGADFGIPDVDSLVNDGTSRNKGIEFTLEKYFNGSYYFLFTGSLYDSKYVPSNGVERNTAFNGNYVINGLFGKEWQLGKKGTVLAIDLKVTQAGNNRYVPIDLEASNAAGKTVYDESLAYEKRYPEYFRLDLKAKLRTQHKRVTQEWVLDIQNLTNHQNVFMERYNPATHTVSTTYQIGMWPMFQYRLLF